MNSCYFDSPIGRLIICEENGEIIQLYLEGYVDEAGEKNTRTQLQVSQNISPILKETCKQLSEYFAGERREFQIPIRPQGTDFQKKVWNALQEIPYGATRSYQDIAVAIDSPKSVRAVGQANHNNHILLVVPCHRVISKSGTLGGFGCGLEVKRYLLELEKKVIDDKH